MDDQQNKAQGRRYPAPFEPAEIRPIRGEKEERLLMQTLSEAQVDFLMQRTPKHEIKMRQGRGGMQFAYVEHGYVTERLNLVFGFNWDFEIIDKQILDDEAIVEARLTVRTPGGQTIIKTQFGGAEIKRHASGNKSGRPLSIADDYKAAASDALKKCASLLGIGLDLYGRDRADDDTEGAPAVTQAPMRLATEEHEAGGRSNRANISEIAGRQVGLCTPHQVREITRLAAAAGWGEPELRNSLGVADISDLTVVRAQRVIARLQEIGAQHRRSEVS